MDRKRYENCYPFLLNVSKMRQIIVLKGDPFLPFLISSWEWPDKGPDPDSFLGRWKYNLRWRVSGCHLGVCLISSEETQLFLLTALSQAEPGLEQRRGNVVLLIFSPNWWILHWQIKRDWELYHPPGVVDLKIGVSEYPRSGVSSLVNSIVGVSSRKLQWDVETNISPIPDVFNRWDKNT